MLDLLLAPLKKWLWLAGIGVLMAAVLLIRKSGADAERLKNAQLDMKAARTVETARSAAKGATDETLNRKVDEWTRH